MSRQAITAYVYDKKGRLLAVGHNSYTKTHPRQADLARRVGTERKTYLHAEVAAIIRAARSGLRAYAIFVSRKGSSGSVRLAAPCPICMLAIQEAGIKEITYTIG